MNSRHALPWLFPIPRPRFNSRHSRHFLAWPPIAFYSRCLFLPCVKSTNNGCRCLGVFAMRIWISIELDSLCCSAYFPVLVRSHTHTRTHGNARFPQSCAKEFVMGEWAAALQCLRYSPYSPPSWPCIKIVAYFQARLDYWSQVAIINFPLDSLASREEAI